MADIIDFNGDGPEDKDDWPDGVPPWMGTDDPNHPDYDPEQEQPGYYNAYGCPLDYTVDVDTVERCYTAHCEVMGKHDEPTGFILRAYRDKLSPEAFVLLHALSDARNSPDMLGGFPVHYPDDASIYEMAGLTEPQYEQAAAELIDKGLMQYGQRREHEPEEFKDSIIIELPWLKVMGTGVCDTWDLNRIKGTLEQIMEQLITTVQAYEEDTDN